MFEYIKGIIIILSPASVVIECNGIGYFIHISLHSYKLFQSKKECQIFIHQIIKEDAHLLFGFADKDERELFRLLISVSGIGANTARMMLSSLSPDEIRSAIMNANVNQLQSIKGIGLKTAQRVILELKEKMSKVGSLHEILTLSYNTIKEESLSALITLGFSKTSVEKVIDKILSEQKDITVEELIKKALKTL